MNLSAYRRRGPRIELAITHFPNATIRLASIRDAVQFQPDVTLFATMTAAVNITKNLESKIEIIRFEKSVDKVIATSNGVACIASELNIEIVFDERKFPFPCSDPINMLDSKFTGISRAMAHMAFENSSEKLSVVDMACDT